MDCHNLVTKRDVGNIQSNYILSQKTNGRNTIRRNFLLENGFNTLLRNINFF